MKKQKYVFPNIKLVALSPKAHFMAITSGGDGFSGNIDSMGDVIED